MRLIVNSEGLGKKNRQQKAEQIEAPKRHVSNRQSSPHIHSPQTAALRPVRLRDLAPHPLHDREYPPRVVENRHEHPNRQREPAGKRHPLHEHLARQQENVRRRRLDALLVPLEYALEYVGDREEQPDHRRRRHVQVEDLVALPEDRRLGVGGGGREGGFGDEVHVEKGEDDEGQVLDADHAAGGENDGDGQGVEKAESEEGSAVGGGLEGGIGCFGLVVFGGEGYVA